MARRILSQAQRTFIQKYVTNGGNGVQAALEAYPTQSYQTASRTASDNLQKDSIRSRILALIAERNIGPDRWAETIEKTLDSDSVEKVPLHNVKLKAIDICAKLAGAYPSESEVRHDHKHAHLHVQVTEPIEVTRFRVLHGRAPTERELKELLPDNPNPDSELRAGK